MSLKGKTAIAGLGITRMGKNYEHSSALGFAAEAISLALADAGLKRSDLDGLLVTTGVSFRDGGPASFALQDSMRLTTRLLADINAGGSSAGTAVAYAAQAIATGTANVVACVFADAPLKPPAPGGKGGGAGDAYGIPRGLDSAYGAFGANWVYALLAQRHMHLYGTTQDQLGAIAISQRQWANRNPMAQFYKEPLTLEGYHASRWITEPLHLYDCCLVSNGGVCVIVTSAQRARDLKKPPVYILGVGQGHHPGPTLDNLDTGIPIAKETAFKMAGVELNDIQVAELYDCYTITVLLSLEGYGLCRKGEGGAFAAQTRLGHAGSIPVNTGGGELSSYYMWGMTPVSEAIIQSRGEGGERQSPKHDVVLASCQTRNLSTHSALVLGTNP
jgi:acetyl-CoA acetyltransferase